MKLHYGAVAMPRSLRDSMNEILGQHGHRPASNCASMSSPAQRIVDKASSLPCAIASGIFFTNTRIPDLTRVHGDVFAGYIACWAATEPESLPPSHTARSPPPSGSAVGSLRMQGPVGPDRESGGLSLIHI